MTILKELNALLLERSRNSCSEIRKDIQKEIDNLISELLILEKEQWLKNDN